MQNSFDTSILSESSAYIKFIYVNILVKVYGVKVVEFKGIIPNQHEVNNFAANVLTR